MRPRSAVRSPFVCLPRSAAGLGEPRQVAVAATWDCSFPPPQQNRIAEKKKRPVGSRRQADPSPAWAKAPAPGLRADGDGVLILSQTSSRKEKLHVPLFLAAKP